MGVVGVVVVVAVARTAGGCRPTRVYISAPHSSSVIACLGYGTGLKAPTSEAKGMTMRKSSFLVAFRSELILVNMLKAWCL